MANKRDDMTKKLTEELTELISSDGERTIDGMAELDGEDLFYALTAANYIIYRMLTGEQSTTLLDYTHMMNKLVVSDTVSRLRAQQAAETTAEDNKGGEA